MEETIEPPAAEILRVPGMESGTKTLATAGPTWGSSVIADIRADKGSMWVMFDCRGAGTAEIALEPLVSMPFTCLDSTITPTMNQIDLKSKTRLRVRVQAPESVEWTLRVTQ
ncbi:hypothetical protein ACBI99_24045 [Nonomuraea sp. ATR24]|uniref:hypothetical protein n=1 Tax=Nonomuraea TaxID=83681 RepID=UPI001C5F5D1B|nr:hypothetical protein [Nonomuraea ceibae]